MQAKIICRKTRRPSELCATEKQRCKRCGALNAPATENPSGTLGDSNAK